MKNRKRLLCGALVLTMAATTVFATSPMTKAETIEIVQDASVNYANTLKIHAKGSKLRIYAWGDSGPLTGDFKNSHGDAMKDEGNGWCSYSFDKEIKGLLILDENGSKKTTQDVTNVTSGEWWYDGSNWSPTNPDGTSTATPTPTPTDKVDPTPPPTKPAEQSGKITIKSVSPESGTELEAGEECTISVDAETDINDEILYYKYKVTCDGKTVGDFYFSKEPTYKFTPESGKKYQVTVYVQAHDEESTTVTETCTYTTSGEAVEETTAPEQTDEPTDPEKTKAPTDPEKTKAPTKTDEPTNPEKTKAPTNTAAPTPTVTATATAKVTPTVQLTAVQTLGNLPM